MNAVVVLRVMAIAAIIQSIGHATLFIRARPRHGPEELAVVEAMQAHRFKFAAAPRSYWDMYVGYGLEAGAVPLVEAMLFWMLAGIAARDVSLVRPIAALFAAANVAHIALVARYFAFPLPMVFDGLIAAGLAYVCVFA